MEIYNSFYKLLQNYSFLFYYMHSLLTLDVKKTNQSQYPYFQYVIPILTINYKVLPSL